ncbi:LysR family transcriptional regulator [Massilia sp. YMA4]|uniref:LysR family transcriptional regulator n=1 Tax=Massilia sp. YMA4 TaxID=1593482 RepID=UPI000DD16BDB|nr:LysR family transcriptional regulator [Massilia sp. YMA4]AXA93199.1 LysR family transcriptional regulator [Massilia sp. YMA4]
MDWDDYRYFVAVADAGSLSAAARRLQQSHSTILRRLDKLEAALAVRLFERFQTGYVLTGAGDELLALLAPLAQQLADVERQVGGRDAQLAGTIRLTTTDTLLQALLLPALADFRRAYPGIALQVTVNNSFLNLTRREADVALRPTNTPPDNLVGRKLGRVRTAPYSTVPRAPADDWAAYDWIAPDEALAHLAQARWLREHVPPERWVFSADTLVGMAAAVEAGIGAGMLLCLLADARPNLVRLAPPPPELDTDVWLLTHPDLRRVSRVRALTEFLANALAAHPALS